MVEGWRNWQRGTLPARRDLPAQGVRAQDPRGRDHGAQRHSGRDLRVTIRSHGENRRWGEGALGASGPVPSATEPRLQLVTIPPGTRCQPHFHAGADCAVYVVSGTADVWHGAGLATRSPVRAGDVLYIPPGAPHLAVNPGDVTSIAVVAHADPADPGDLVVIELPRHLAALLRYPVAVGA